MWFENRPKHHKKPFVARWRGVGGRVHSRSFLTPKDRDTFKRAFEKKRTELGKTATIVRPITLEKWREFDELVDHRDPITVAREWLAYKAAEVDPGMPLSVAIKRYGAAMEGRKLSPDSIGHRNLHLKRFLDAHPDGYLSQITTDTVVEWLANLPLSRGKTEAAPKTIHAHRATLARFFGHAVAARWCDHNPCDAVPVPDLEKAETINILTIEEVRSLFANNEHATCIGRLALEAFGGLRYTSAARLTRDDLNPDDRGITFPAPKHKSGRRHYVEGFPANLWLWVEHAPAACWELTQRQYLEAKRMAFVQAGLKGPDASSDDDRMRNVLRHSFATYHAAAHKDLNNTARLLTHHSVNKLYSNYMGRAKKADGLAYFDIKPTLMLGA